MSLSSHYKGNYDISQEITIYEQGIKDMEARKVTIEKATQIMQEAMNRGSLVINPKTNETIWEIEPEVDEIEIVEFLGGG